MYLYTTKYMEEPNVISPEVTSAISTDGGGAVSETKPKGKDSNRSSECWYVLWVNSKAEKSVRNNLIEKGFQAYVATRQEIHTWRRGERRKVEKVLIPSIVFVRMDRKDQRTIEDCPGVSALMRDPARKKEGISSWDKLARVSNDDMQVFQQMLGQEETDVNFTTTDFTVGEYVHIKDFPEGNNKAQIVRIYGDTKTYVGLRVSFLGCAYMQVPLNRIVKL